MEFGIVKSFYKPIKSLFTNFIFCLTNNSTHLFTSLYCLRIGNIPSLIFRNFSLINILLLIKARDVTVKLVDPVLKLFLNIDHNQTFICIFISLNRALPPFL
jgi:hypothetical protein